MLEETCSPSLKNIKVNEPIEFLYNHTPMIVVQGGEIKLDLKAVQAAQDLSKRRKPDVYCHIKKTCVLTRGIIMYH